MKYIVFTSGEAILFADRCDHKFMAQGRPVRSAGFVRVETKRNRYDDVVVGSCDCYGYSHSLGVGCMEGDSERVKEIFRGMS